MKMGSEVEVEVKNPEEEELNEFYAWELTPKRNSEETKNCVTFKGDVEDYIRAHGVILKHLDKKGAKYFINEREIRILDNVKNNPIKIEIKPLKGETGNVNIKLYNVKAKGGATIVISKVSDGNLLHVKSLAFKVIQYLIDGIIDGEIADKDFESFKHETEVTKNKDELSYEKLRCSICDRVFKTKHGLNIHRSKLHDIEKNTKCSVTENLNQTGIRKYCKYLNVIIVIKSLKLKLT
jgi:hypothetical protein